MIWEVAGGVIIGGIALKLLSQLYKLYQNWKLNTALINAHKPYAEYYKKQAEARLNERTEIVEYYKKQSEAILNARPSEPEKIDDKSK